VPDDTLLVFLKPPRPGLVKTRLAPALGERLAADLYRALAEEVLLHTSGDEYRRLLFYTPEDAKAEMEAWFPSEEWALQEGGDLGTRMANAFAAAFSKGARRAVIIGTDAPEISRGRVLKALACLENHDVAIGPARDGGYYLLALRRPEPELFRSIEWSTPAVLEETLRRAEAQGVSVAVLETLGDVDTLDDLRAEWDHLASLLARRPELRDALARALGTT
jgi:rSAM/selenodomain-associated transferase 1